MTTASKQKPIERVDMKELEDILEEVRGALSEERHRKLKAAVETLAYLTSEIEDKTTTIRKLRRLLFGSTSEKLRDVLEDPPEEPDSGQTEKEEEQSEAAPQDSSDSMAGEPAKEPRKRPGHGRNGAAKYVGAEVIEISHESLKPGDACPTVSCEGRVYRLADPAVLVRIVGQAPMPGKVYRLERLRCNLCLTVFTAKPPQGVGEEKYDASAVAMMAILRYGSGLPLHRLEVLQGSLGIPLPASTQWEVVARKVGIFEPVYHELIRQAAQAGTLYNDDTSMKILEFMKEDRERLENEKDSSRKGVQTSGIVAEMGGIRMAVFFTGREHAGENLATVLSRRESELPVPIQMCDALLQNVSKDFETILCNCMSHARRQYVDVVEDFPHECRFVLETLAEVFKNDAIAREGGMSPQARLEFHREESLPRMAALRLWSWKAFKERTVEPNSGLGKAINYMRRHWRKLTRFLYVPGAPLHNNLCERILKKAIIHRNNSLFYKTENGARVGDLYMSLIATCQLVGVNPFEYLTAVQGHSGEAASNPGAWLPWTYASTLAGLDSS
jgi:hypothetical protein